MSYKDTALNNERQHNRKYFSGGGGGSKKCYSDRSLYSLPIIMTIRKAPAFWQQKRIKV